MSGLDQEKLDGFLAVRSYRKTETAALSAGSGANPKPEAKPKPKPAAQRKRVQNLGLIGPWTCIFILFETWLFFSWHAAYIKEGNARRAHSRHRVVGSKVAQRLKDLTESKMWPIKLMGVKHQETLRVLHQTVCNNCFNELFLLCDFSWKFPQLMHALSIPKNALQVTLWWPSPERWKSSSSSCKDSLRLTSRTRWRGHLWYTYAMLEFISHDDDFIS